MRNAVGATVSADGGYITLPAGTYFYELTVGGVANTNRYTNLGVYTQLAVNGPTYVFNGYDYDGNPSYSPAAITTISTCAASGVGDWQRATISGPGRFTLSTTTDVMVIIYPGSVYPIPYIEGYSGYINRHLKIWRDTN
jgi:hypothetical protein